MRVPFQCLLVSGDIIFAAQGDSIHAFDQGLTLLSTWRHPGKPGGEKADASPENGSKEPMTEGQDSPAGEGPPSKRRKLEGGDQETEADDDEDGEEDDEQTAEPGEDQPEGERMSKKRRRRKNRRKRRGGMPPSRLATYSTPSEKPFVLSLNSTSDGRYVIAVTGSDKTIWVFEHDGKGHLQQLSQRTMPKRPSSLCLTLDEETILCADKFGDVYSLPLIPKSDSPTTSTPEREETPAAPAAPRPFKPQASETTVHLKRNRMALENQLRAKAAAPPKEGPNFEHTLLLGHVSMATGVLMLKDPATGRPYIVTSDRDEHIRVSRGVLSQAYIIDHFCFGHEDFINRLSAVPGRPELLLSAGGDDELFMWNWTTGNLLAKRDVLEHVMKVVPSADKIAVLGLHAHALPQGGEDAHWVFLICERVPALLCFRITISSDLELVQTVLLPGNPLGMAWTQQGPDGLLVSVDANKYPAQGEEESTEAGESSGKESVVSTLQVLKKGDSEWRLEDVPLPQGDAADLAMDMKPDELQKALYTVENMRKYGMGEDS